MNARADEARGALLLALRGAGIRDLAVLRALEAVTREDFLPHRLRDLGGRNIALPIACGQTMSPPLTLARTLEALAVQSTDRVLEIGTGTGYATAVLARLARTVVTVERYRTLATEAEDRLRRLHVDAQVVFGDGMAFPAGFGRFERIVVHAAIDAVPRALDAALTDNGRLVAGVRARDGMAASLAVFERDGDSFACRTIAPVRLSPAQTGVAIAL